MSEHFCDFPFVEYRKGGIDGDFFASVEEAFDEGWSEDQIWSIVECGEDEWTYGPPHHYINLIGYVATHERHDGETYYHSSVMAL